MCMVGELLRLLGAGLILLLIPLLAGNGFLSLFKLQKNLAGMYLSGLVLIWAITQLVAVPLILLRQSFTMAFTVITVLVALCCVFGIYKNKFFVWKRPGLRLTEWAAVAVTLLCVAGLLFITLVTQHTDADDSRFVVNAVDMLRTDTMLLTNPATGSPLEIWEGELIKDVTAPWAVFIAWCAKLTGTHATVMAHTVLPQILLLAAVSVWWMLSEVFFKKELTYRCMFMALVILLNVYGHFSVYSEEVFLLTRIWQGKAVVAGIGIPAAYLVGCRIYQGEGRGDYVLLILLNLAMCLMSGMGLIIGILMLGCMGLVYGIAKKNRKICAVFWLGCIPNIVYYVIHVILQ